ncbi:hypothetical protein M0R45_013774 [Rubus argutus]|uniref:Uncharacterized protein n=1 Tax=Rubus argutus TaxID=59490 RepID=A0AAW1XKM7_RUBAR
MGVVRMKFGFCRRCWVKQSLHGWAEWVPRSIGRADLGLIAAFNGGNLERSQQLGKRIDAGSENRGRIEDAGWIGGAARVCRGGAAKSSACTEEARMIGLHSGVGNFSKGAMEELPWVDELGSSRLSLWPCEIADEGSDTTDVVVLLGLSN